MKKKTTTTARAKRVAKVTRTKTRRATPDAPVFSDPTYMLRTCGADMRSHGGFLWPTSGLVTAPDWKAKAQCGNGLHGLLHGQGNQGLLSFEKDAKWLVVQVERSEVVAIDALKEKVPRAIVVFVGAMDEAVAKLVELDSEAGPVHALPGGAASATGESGAASATGSRGAASATGSRGAASATGESGAASATGYSGAASATGYSGAASATGESGAASATGESGAASATGYSGAASATGESGAASATGSRGAASATGSKGIALARNGSRARVGADGLLILIDDSGPRPRAVVRYAGEDGIEPLKWYKLDSKGAVVESPDKDLAFLWTPCDIEAVIVRRQEEAAWEAREKIKAMLAELAQ